MKEEFLHYLWKYQLFEQQDVFEIEGQVLKIIHPGESNTDAGPDFFNAKIQLGPTVWVGNVEVHLKSSDWDKHKHSDNTAYDNVILHVVGNNDIPVIRKSGEKIPCLVIAGSANMLEQYTYLMNSKTWIPCESFIDKVDEFTLLQWKERLLVERLQEKSNLIQERFIKSGNNFEDAFYQTLAYNMGFKTNSLPFEMVAKSLPIKYLGKHKDQLSLLEAMIFGQAGLIPEYPGDAYVIQLQQDYNHLKAKFKLKPIESHLWKFMRMRPANFPTIRLAQFAALIHQSSGLFSKIIEAKTMAEIEVLFDIKASKYWDTHYTFNKDSEKKVKILGKTAFNNIVINTIAPVLFFYAKAKGKEEYFEIAMDLLSEVNAENNNITRGWQALGLKMEHAFDSQALIQLKNVYCKSRGCLKCRIGNQVIKYNL